MSTYRRALLDSVAPERPVDQASTCALRAQRARNPFAADGGAGPTLCTAKPGAAIGEACTTSTDCARSAGCNAQHVCAFSICE